MRGMRKLFRFTGAYKKYALLTPLLMCGEVAMEILIPFVMANMIDNGIQGAGGVPYTVRMGLLMTAMAALSLFFGAMAGKFAAKGAVGFSSNVRRALFEKIQAFSFANTDRFPASSLVTRLTTDVTNVQNAFMMLTRMAIRAPLMLIGALVMALSINARLALVFLVAMPVLGGCVAFIMSRSFKRFKAMLERYDHLNARVQENLVAIRVVKAFVREDYETVRFQDEADTLRKAQVFAEKLVILSMPIMQLCMYGCIVAVFWFGGNMVAQGTFMIGELSSFISYVTQVLMSLMMLSMVFLMLILSRASITRINEVFDEEIDIRDDQADPNLKVADGSVDFDQVSFRYRADAKECALQNIDLHIPAGATVGILGGTGSAKTTLVQLIPRLYDASEGTVRVGGRDVKAYKLDALRDAVAMVLQKNVLFSGTIADNLRWGNKDATDAEIAAACDAACAASFIEEFPDGYQTVLGQGGVNLSGGQKQRLCIARALLKNPKVVILDDSTSAVDTATDARLRKALSERYRDTTTIIIAQRVTSVMEADMIVVLDDGQISAVGNHESLMRDSAIYREVYDVQQKGVA